MGHVPDNQAYINSDVKNDRKFYDFLERERERDREREFFLFQIQFKVNILDTTIDNQIVTGQKSTLKSTYSRHFPTLR